ncbi:MAG: glycosyltransferase family 2 protein [Flavobacterium sp.]|uniref:glycosyltransferase family 2 protein n=1 Tax=Flavobacterium sp. TaxID=239 RepID=UPI00262CECA7|nr:glycosyltransferase family 2 protein [Flavobacterium sp.]MDD5151089.1 glycosyltransferase family 2 protein [Flavobacterium sp.]
MIVVYHRNNRISKIVSNGKKTFSFDKKETIANGLLQLAIQFPQSIIVWCEEVYQEYLNLKEIPSLFHHHKIILSYHQNEVEFLGSTIGYVEQSPFIKINKSVTFPTWQMSSAVGGVYAEVLLALKEEIYLDKNFDYFLCSLAKLAMPKGLLCYSEPNLLKEKPKEFASNTSSFTVFRFVKQHYKTQWVFLLFFNIFLYEQKFPILPFLFSFFYKNRTKATINLDGIKIQSSKKVVNQATVDVIIPTIGRKNNLYDVLKDLKVQTHLPATVIIVEQNPDEESKSELDYLTNEKWPFKIEHIFIHQAGACNARNLALNQIQSEWVFLADDDIRIDNDFIEKTFEKINSFGAKVVTLKCFQKGQSQPLTTIFQWITFGSGCSFVFADSLRYCKFKMGYEFGYGEDGDFGMQLRNLGQDVLFLPEPSILHLKASMGGFRTKPVLQWQNENIQPKPSPTVMLYQILHNTREQQLGYKIILFFKYYRLQKIKNPLKYYFNFQKQWKSSIFWANQLKAKNEV